jgi:hypothetical protein
MSINMWTLPSRRYDSAGLRNPCNEITMDRGDICYIALDFNALYIDAWSI